MIVVGGWPGRNVVGLNGRFGVRPADFAAGGDFDNPFLNDVDAGDEAREFVGVVSSLPSSGVVVFDDLGGFQHTGAADGTYTTVFDLFTWAQGGPVTAHTPPEEITTTFGSTSTAAGATLTAAASLVPGSAVGSVGATASGALVTVAAALIAGSATGQTSATATGMTLTAAASMTPGAAAGAEAGVALGATMTAAAALIPVAATGQQAATAPGATVQAAASLLRGNATGSTGGSADPAAVWSYVLADGRTAEQTLLDNNRMLRIVLAALSGQTAGIGTATETYFGEDGVTPRLVATFDSAGNRVSVLTDGAP